MDSDRPGPDRLGRELTWFIAVGAIGFVVDAGLFLLLHSTFDWSIPAARTASASCSIGTTWALNRRFTFTARRSHVWSIELGRYTLVQTAGLVVNFGVFALALSLLPSLRATPVVALAIGAGAALAFNFLSARTLVFRGRGAH